MTLTRRYVDFSYVDGNEYVFMDKEDYTPYTFTKDQIEEELLFMPEGGMPDMQVLTGTVSCWRLSCRRPLIWKSLKLHGIKGASASARNKPATLSTGLVIQVPEYLSPGEKFVSISKNAVIWVVLTNFSRMQKRDSSGCPFLIYYTNLLFCAS